MTTYEYGSPDAATVLLQPVDDDDLSMIEGEVAAIRELAGSDFRLIAVKVDSWNKDLSPWEAPAVFGDEEFGNGADGFLAMILKMAGEQGKTYYIGGYSLAGLFALWAAYQTDVFAGVAAASPSIWFPGFAEFMRENEIRCRAVYLSLGDREERTRNPVMATVGDRIRDAQALLNENGTECVLEWNKGNHFKQPDQRTAKAFAWLINRAKAEHL